MIIILLDLDNLYLFDLIELTVIIMIILLNISINFSVLFIIFIHLNFVLAGLI